MSAGSSSVGSTWTTAQPNLPMISLCSSKKSSRWDIGGTPGWSGLSGRAITMEQAYDIFAGSAGGLENRTYVL
nr:hypothetical protein Ade03nite_15550 [Actinoplanes derwentensis]